MKKKTRIIASFSALALSMAMLTGGVLSATSVSLNVSSTVSFEATGLYLKAEGQVKRGTSSSRTNLAETERPEEEQSMGYSYSYLDYSYVEDTDGTPLGSSSFEDMPEWTIGTIVFTESENVVEYAFTFTNYSEYAVSVNITPNVASTLEEVTTANVSGAQTLTIQPNASQNFSYTLTLDNVASSVTGAVGFTVQAERYVQQQLYDVTVPSWQYYWLESSDEIAISQGETFQYSGKIAVFFGSSYIEPDNWDILNSIIVVNPPQDRGESTYSIKVNGVTIDSITLEGGDPNSGTAYIILDIQEDSVIECLP